MTERQIPGGVFLNETGNAERQVPGGTFVNESAGDGPIYYLFVHDATHSHLTDNLSVDPSVVDLIIADTVHTLSTTDAINITAPVEDEEVYPGAAFGFLPTLGGEMILPPSVAPILTLTPNAGAGTILVEWDTIITAYMTHDVEIRLPI